jgi:hypothetical protein
MTTMRFFEIIYKGATNNSGARVIVKDLRFNKRRIIAYNYGINSITEMAIHFLKSKGIEITCKGENINSMLIGTEDFEIQI